MHGLHSSVAPGERYVWFDFVFTARGWSRVAQGVYQIGVVYARS
jgi:hypothetical protein